MHVVGSVLLGLIALEHVYFLYLEMFRWTAPATLRAFNLSPEFAEQSKALAANQGLYNGFLAAGLIWAAVGPARLQTPLALFFTACVVIAGIFGALTVTRRILFLQALPAAVTLAVVVLTW